MHSMINDLERIGDIYFQMSKTFEQMENENIKLPKEARQEVSELLDLVRDAIKNMRFNMEHFGNDIDLTQSIKLEQEINFKRDRMKDAHYNRLENGVYDSKAGVIYLDYLTRLEKIGDHIFNVNEALAGKKLKTHSDMVIKR
jgi:phosphate:Na+ symporter